MKILCYMRKLLIAFLMAIILTGCPGYGDRLRPTETTTINPEHDAICFNVSDAKDYQPASIFISPPGTAPRDAFFVHRSNLKVNNDRMCIPYSFYPFPAEGQLIVDYVLTSKRSNVWPRRVVVAIEFDKGVPRGIPLEGYQFY